MIPKKGDRGKGERRRVLAYIPGECPKEAPQPNRCVGYRTHTGRS